MFVVRYFTGKDGLPTYMMRHEDSYEEAVKTAEKIIDPVASWTLKGDVGSVEVMEYINHRFVTRWAVLNIKGEL